MSESFRSYMQEELVRRCQKNPAYSLRAYAKALQTDHSTLGKILASKRPLGKRAVLKFADRLGVSPQKLQEIQKQDISTVQSMDSYQSLASDAFQVIAEWYHFAILELMRIDSFCPQPRWISSALGLSVAEVKAARDRLVRVGMLKITEDGSWRDISNVKTTNITPGSTSTAQRLLQKRILELAIEALDETKIEERDQTAMTMAIDQRRLPEAKEKIKKFRRDIAKFLSRSNQRQEVYHLSISLYPVSKIKRRFHALHTKGK